MNGLPRVVSQMSGNRGMIFLRIRSRFTSCASASSQYSGLSASIAGIEAVIAAVLPAVLAAVFAVVVAIIVDLTRVATGSGHRACHQARLLQL